MHSLKKLTIASSILALGLTACGGGGGSSTPPSSGGGGGSDWVQGQFDPAANFKNFCQSPRSGTSDRSGAVLDEKNWLRSWSNETYLWYNEITDIDPASVSYPTAVSYFDILKTNATTASGAPRDQFHFYMDSEEYQLLQSSGASAGYGARVRLLSSAPPRQAVIAYIEPGSPAEAAGLMRGDEIIEVDGAAIVDGDANVLNAGLFPDGEGEQHTFVVQAPGATTTRTVTMTSAIVTSSPVLKTGVETLGSGETVGYILFNTFGVRTAEDALINAFNDMSNQNVDHLVLDLRYNGGGFLTLSAELGYMIAGASNTSGRIYETLVFNDKHPTVNPVTGNTITPTPFYSTTQGISTTTPSGRALPSVNLNKVYILSSGSTCSASESLINGLLGVDVEVVLIGSTTCGKPYGFYPTDNCGTTYFTVQFRGENEKGFGDYADGFSPMETGLTVTGEPVDGCVVSDDFDNPLGDNSEAMFSAALTHINTGACPASDVAKTDSFKMFEKPASFEDGNLLEDPRIKTRNVLENSRILEDKQ